MLAFFLLILQITLLSANVFWAVAKPMTIHAVVPLSNINKNEKTNIAQNPPASV